MLIAKNACLINAIRIALSSEKAFDACYGGKRRLRLTRPYLGSQTVGGSQLSVALGWGCVCWVEVK